MLESLIGLALKAFLSELFKNLFGFLDKQAQDATHERLGASRVTATVNQKTAETTDAMARVPDASPDDVAGRLQSGSF